MPTNDSETRVLIVAPLGQDATAMADLLTRHGFKGQICSGPAECQAQMQSGAGALVMTEEALEIDSAFDFLSALNAQPAWSELPLIILTAGGEARLARLLELAAAAAGSVTLLERPIRTITLLRSIEVALNSRRRQYQVRDLLEEQSRSALQLREAHESLANHARELETLVQLRTAKLAESNEQLRREMIERAQAEAAREALRRELINAQEEERRRIARELHDQMGQNLTALNFGLKSLHDSDPDGNALPALLRPLQKLAQQTARDLHRVALELRPAALDDLGLVKAVRNLVETWSTHYHVEADFEAGNYDPNGISSEVETTLYRIIQEGLNNAAKHSGATRISVVLLRAADHVEAIIEDNGRGFNPANRLQSKDGHGRLGLVGMEERLSGIGGSLHIESGPGSGTTLIVRIPLVRRA